MSSATPIKNAAVPILFRLLARRRASRRRVADWLAASRRALGAVAASLERLAELAAEELARRLAEFALRARLARRLRRVPHSSWVQGLWTRLALLSAWRGVLLRLARARRFGRSAIERLRFLRNRGLGAWCVSRSGWGELRPGKLALGRLGRRVESRRTRPSRVTSKVRGV